MQTITSKHTSRNHLPAVYRLAKKAGYWKPGLQGVDLGCGRSLKLEAKLEEEDVFLMGWDPHWKTEQENSSCWENMNGVSDFAVVSNVLNVINCPAARSELLFRAKAFLREGGRLLVTVYDGSRDGEGGVTRAGWQENRKLGDYLLAVRSHFPNAELKGGMIVATKEDA